MNINWSELISKNYWLDVERSGVLHLTDKIILGFGSAIFVAGVLVLLAKLLTKNQLIKPTLARISGVFISIGLLEMLWYLLRLQYVTALSSRLAALIVGVIGIVYLVKPFKYFIFKYKADTALYDQQQIKQKYLDLRSK